MLQVALQDAGAPFGILATQNAVNLVLKLLVFAIAGAFGGLVYGIITLFESGKAASSGVPSWQAAKGAPVGWYLTGQMVVGVGGAFAAVFAVITAGHVANANSAGDSPAASVYWIALSLVGGFVGNRLLTVVGKDLVDRIAKANRNSELAVDNSKRAVDLASEATRDSADTAKRSEMNIEVLVARDLDKAISKAGSTIPVDLRTRAEQQLKQLSSYVPSFPTDRILNIVLANLKFDLGLRQEAVDQLRAFIAARRDASATEDNDDAAAHFNLACYFVLMATGEQKEENVRAALNELSACLKIARSLGHESLALHLAKVENDDDLAPIRGTEEYRNLIDPIKRQLTEN